MSAQDPSWPDGDDSSSNPPPPPPPPPGGGAPPPPPGAPRSTGSVGATVGVRFGARFIDGIITGIISFVLSFAVPGNSTFVAGLLGAIVALGYFVFLETSSGATPGKQLLNLRVVGAGGGHPTVEESLRRNAWLALGILGTLGAFAQLAAAIAIAVTISSSDSNRGWHDEFGGTTVLRT